MSALDWLFDEVEHHAVLRSHATLVSEARAELAQLRTEIDRYDKVCTAVRNELNNAGIPELTDDKLSVRSLVARVALLRAELAEEQEVVESARNVIEIIDILHPDFSIVVAWLAAHPEETK